MIGEGEEAPSFTLPGTEGESIHEYSLADLTDDGPALLLFYPFDFSPVCADQLCTFRDAEWLIFTEALDVVGISIDSVHAHKQFITEYDLQFPLLTDRLGNAAEAYGLLLDEFEEHPRVPKRAVVAVDDSQNVRYTWAADSQYASPGIDAIEESIGWYRSPPEEE